MSPNLTFPHIVSLPISDAQEIEEKIQECYTWCYFSCQKSWLRRVLKNERRDYVGLRFEFQCPKEAIVFTFLFGGV
jgi:hypothetical protein